MPEIHITYEEGFEIATLLAGNSEARIVPEIGNTLFSLKLRGREVLFFPQTLTNYAKSKNLFGNPFLFPWANRLEKDSIIVEGKEIDFPDDAKQFVYRDKNDLPLHGLILKSNSWKISDQGKNEKFAWLETTLTWNQSMEAFQLFPFEVIIKTVFELGDESCRITTTIYNESQKVLPLSFGYHPYFVLKGKREDILLDFPLDHYYETDNKLLPTGHIIPLEKAWSHFKNSSLGKLNLDHGFPIVGNIFSFTDEEKTLEITFEKGYNTAVIYAPANDEKPFICIEPMTAPTNAMHLFAQGKIPTLLTLVTGENQSFIFSISIK